MINSVVLPGTVVSARWLSDNLGRPGLVVADIRGYVHSTAIDDDGHQVAQYVGAPEEYAEGHIPGAVFIDWTKDITDPDNPVPAQIAPPDRFAEAMASRGIGDDTAVVIADHAGGHFATRLWWALRYYGHDNVAILDGGYRAWTAAGLAMTADAPDPVRAAFTPRVRPELVASAADVKDAISRSDITIVDARDPRTFSGEVYRGSRRGHIAGAVNMPIAQFLDEEGLWRSPAALQTVLESIGLTNGSNVIAYCNGGVTATAVLFALDRIGHQRWANYDGSWNEWAERFELPVESDV